MPSRIGGVYLCGGALNDYGLELAANTAMMESIQAFADSGGVVYSEGSGTAWLCRDFSPGGKSEALAGVGIIPASACMQVGSSSYDEAVTVEDSVLGRPGLIVKSFSTGEWKLQGADGLMKVLRVSRQAGPALREGFSPGAQMLCTFSFAHFGSNPEIAKNLVDSCEVVLRLDGSDSSVQKRPS